MPEITKTAKRRPKFDKRIVRLLFIVLILITYFLGLNLPLLGPDEPRYAEVAREMFLRGDWITPRLGGFDWFEKPALLYWLQIVFFKIFGVTEFAARFGSALFGLGTIFCLWILGRQWSELSGQRTIEKEDAGFRIRYSDFADYLALFAASSIGLITFSHAASFDVILTFPITAALVAFFLFTQSKQKSGSAMYVRLFIFYFFIGVALLAKGLVGIVFPFAIVAFYYVLQRRMPGKTFLWSLIWGTILSLVVAAFWYVPVYQANGWKFVDEFIIQHHFQRFTSDKYQHHQPFWFFFLVLPLMTLPWLPFFLVAVWNFLKEFVQKLKFESKNSYPESAGQKTGNELKTNELPPIINHQTLFINYQLRLFAVAWLLVPLVFFSLSGSKLPGYILPSLPAAIILAADYAYHFVQNNPQWRRSLSIIAAAVFVSVIIALQFFAGNFARRETVKDLIATADAQGFSQAEIANLYTMSYNAEFYGAGRLLRLPDGRQKYFDNVGALYEELKDKDQPTLVILPLDGVKYLTESDVFTAQVLGDNGSLAIAAVRKK